MAITSASANVACDSAVLVDVLSYMMGCIHPYPNPIRMTPMVSSTGPPFTRKSTKPRAMAAEEHTFV